MTLLAKRDGGTIRFRLRVRRCPPLLATFYMLGLVNQGTGSGGGCRPCAQPPTAMESLHPCLHWRHENLASCAENVILCLCAMHESKRDHGTADVCRRGWGKRRSGHHGWRSGAAAPASRILTCKGSTTASSWCAERHLLWMLNRTAQGVVVGASTCTMLAAASSR